MLCLEIEPGIWYIAFQDVIMLSMYYTTMVLTSFYLMESFSQPLANKILMIHTSKLETRRKLIRAIKLLLKRPNLFLHDSQL